MKFVTNSGRTARKHQPETMVAGIALLDYDNDGWLDIHVANGYVEEQGAKGPVRDG